MSFVLQVDYYESAKVISLAPGLVILIANKSRRPRESTELKERCDKCKERLRAWPLDPAQQNELFSLTGRPPFEYLSCDCLCVVFGSHLARADIITRWKKFRRLQNRVLSWAVLN